MFALVQIDISGSYIVEGDGDAGFHKYCQNTRIGDSEFLQLLSNATFMPNDCLRLVAVVHGKFIDRLQQTQIGSTTTHYE